MSETTNEVQTEEDFRALCLQIERDDYVPLPYVPMDQYFKEGDLVQYRDAQAWWPKDAPLSLALPPLSELAKYRRSASVDAPPVSFVEILNAIGARCRTWLDLEGRDVAYPNETAAQRKARKNKEAQSRFRESKKADLDPEAQARHSTRKELWDAYIGLCQERRAIEDDYKARIAAAYNEYMQAPK